MQDHVRLDHHRATCGHANHFRLHSTDDQRVEDEEPHRRVVPDAYHDLQWAGPMVRLWTVGERFPHHIVERYRLDAERLTGLSKVQVWTF